MSARQRTALLRLVVICAAWALGEALVWQLGVRELGLVVPAILGAGAYLGTRDLGWSGPGEGSYWRGRRVDRDRRH